MIDQVYRFKKIQYRLTRTARVQLTGLYLNLDARTTTERVMSSSTAIPVLTFSGKCSRRAAVRVICARRAGIKPSLSRTRALGSNSSWIKPIPRISVLYEQICINNMFSSSRVAPPCRNAGSNRFQSKNSLDLVHCVPRCLDVVVLRKLKPLYRLALRHHELVSECL